MLSGFVLSAQGSTREERDLSPDARVDFRGREHDLEPPHLSPVVPKHTLSQYHGFNNTIRSLSTTRSWLAATRSQQHHMLAEYRAVKTIRSLCTAMPSTSRIGMRHIRPANRLRQRYHAQRHPADFTPDQTRPRMRTSRDVA
eukprot:2515698-Rhodomonas_salina.6